MIPLLVQNFLVKQVLVAVSTKLPASFDDKLLESAMGEDKDKRKHRVLLENKLKRLKDALRELVNVR